MYCDCEGEKITINFPFLIHCSKTKISSISFPLFLWIPLVLFSTDGEIDHFISPQISVSTLGGNLEIFNKSILSSRGKTVVIRSGWIWSVDLLLSVTVWAGHEELYSNVNYWSHQDWLGYWKLLMDWFWDDDGATRGGNNGTTNTKEHSLSLSQ